MHVRLCDIQILEIDVYVLFFYDNCKEREYLFIKNKTYVIDTNVTHLHRHEHLFVLIQKKKLISHVHTRN